MSEIIIGLRVDDASQKVLSVDWGFLPGHIKNSVEAKEGDTLAHWHYQLSLRNLRPHIIGLEWHVSPDWNHGQWRYYILTS